MESATILPTRHRTPAAIVSDRTLALRAATVFAGAATDLLAYYGEGPASEAQSFDEENLPTLLAQALHDTLTLELLRTIPDSERDAIGALQHALWVFQQDMG